MYTFLSGGLADTRLKSQGFQRQIYLEDLYIYSYLVTTFPHRFRFSDNVSQDLLIYSDLVRRFQQILRI